MNDIDAIQARHDLLTKCPPTLAGSTYRDAHRDRGVLLARIRELEAAEFEQNEQKKGYREEAAALRIRVKELEAERDEWKQAAGAEAYAGDEARAEAKRYRDTLERIANTDYRGPEPDCMVVARKALADGGEG